MVVNMCEDKIGEIKRSREKHVDDDAEPQPYHRMWRQCHLRILCCSLILEKTKASFHGDLTLARTIFSKTS